MGHKSSHH